MRALSTIALQPSGVRMSREQRKLAAILAADVVGCSRLMGRDESGTLARSASSERSTCRRGTGQAGQLTASLADVRSTARILASRLVRARDGSCFLQCTNDLVAGH